MYISFKHPKKYFNPKEGSAIWATSGENLFMPYANNKCADQPAHPRSLISTFVVRCLDSIIPLASISEMSSLYLFSLAAQAGLSPTWSQTPKTCFLMTWLILCLPTPETFFFANMTTWSWPGGAKIETCAITQDLNIFEATNIRINHFNMAYIDLQCVLYTNWTKENNKHGTNLYMSKGWLSLMVSSILFPQVIRFWNVSATLGISNWFLYGNRDWKGEKQCQF